MSPPSPEPSESENSACPSASFTAAMGAKTGEEITLKGKSFTVAAVLSESGTIDDSRAWVHLSDAQALLDMPGVVNEIQALECYCKDVGVDNLARLRED